MIGATKRSRRRWIVGGSTVVVLAVVAVVIALALGPSNIARAWRITGIRGQEAACKALSAEPSQVQQVVTLGEASASPQYSGWSHDLESALNAQDDNRIGNDLAQMSQFCFGSSRTTSTTTTTPTTDPPTTTTLPPPPPAPTTVPPPPPTTVPPPPTTIPLPPPPPAPHVVLTQSGSGGSLTSTFRTRPFQIGAGWTLKYSFDCTGLYSGYFGVDIEGVETPPDPAPLIFGKNGPRVGNEGVNELAMKGADSIYEPWGGTLDLAVTSQCAWTIQAVGTSS